MATEIKVPTLGESVTEATVAKWMKSVGDAVAADEPLVELETDKVTLEVNAPATGTLSDIVADEGAEVEVGALLGVLAEGAGAPPVAAPAAATEPAPASPGTATQTLSPAVRKLIEENNLDAMSIPATGKDGRLVKGDVLAFMESGVAAPAQASAVA
ncbi:MAG: biotin/lipoyl-containing protein, partial [Rhodospirillales bacterium]|nr:biotin/lipoyl-containing protein [Rhodospirillales bacterium]